MGVAGAPGPGRLRLGVEVSWLGAEALGFRPWWVHHDAETERRISLQGSLNHLLRNHPVGDGEMHAGALTVAGREQHQDAIPLGAGVAEVSLNLEPIHQRQTAIILGKSHKISEINS